MLLQLLSGMLPKEPKKNVNATARIYFKVMIYLDEFHLWKAAQSFLLKVSVYINRSLEGKYMGGKQVYRYLFHMPLKM